MRSVQKIGLVMLIVGYAAFFGSWMYFHPALVLTWLFLPPSGAFMYVYPSWQEQVKCPHCGAVNKATYKKCAVCGLRPFISFYVSGDKGETLGAVYSKREYMLRLVVYAIGISPILIFLLIVDLWPISLAFTFIVVVIFAVQYRKALKRQKLDYDGGSEQYQPVLDSEGGMYFEKE